MKKYVLILLLGVAFKSYAATGLDKTTEAAAPDLELDQRASAMTQLLVNRLHLNEGEYIHLRAVHRILLTSIDSIDTQYASDPAQRRIKLQELQGYYEQERLRALTPSQISRLEEKPVRESMPVINVESGGLG